MTAAPGAWQVICLCADWCGTCREWQPQLAALACGRPHVRFAWVDVEDQSEAVGDIDIETFPTLLIACGTQPRFFGPVLPHINHLERLLDTLQQDEWAGLVLPGSKELLSRLQNTGLKLI